MIRDILNRKKIDAQAEALVQHVAKCYPPEMDAGEANSLGQKVNEKKRYAKLEKAIHNSLVSVTETVKEMRLGVYGKARLYKNVQNGLIEKGYNEVVIRVIVEKLVSVT